MLCVKGENAQQGENQNAFHRKFVCIFCWIAGYSKQKLIIYQRSSIIAYKFH